MSTALREQIQAALGHGYTLERELGGGGMSRVFLAEEARLGRRVVVKVLAPELTEGMSAERFEREVRLAARLQHPNIVPLLAAGERDGLAFYTMPYVEGESLRARLVRGGQLRLDAAVSVLRDVARALEYAHARGVVHRDIKPENILLAGSAAAVADFGIAKALHVARTAGTAEALGEEQPLAGAPTETLTRVGTSLGTPAYMAPEQAAGDPDVDARADIYAWGVVAFELLAGAPPFAGRAAHQLVAAHIGEPAPALALRAREAPPGLAALVMSCLEKDPKHRPQSASDLLAALDAARTPSGPRRTWPAAGMAPQWLRITLVVVTGLLVAIIAVTASHMRRQVAPHEPVLAVLPFENLGPAADAYFADGLTEEVRGRIARIAGLRVISGKSARQYQGSTKSPREIARELGATHLLTATVRWERMPGGAGRVRVSPELFRASDQATVWAEPSQGALGDVFQLQTELAARVAVALDLALLARERRDAPARPTTNIVAYDAYLRGLSARERWQAIGWRPSIAEFTRAATLDPAFTLAHARLAEAQLEDVELGSADSLALGNARASLARAWALDSSLVEVQRARGRYLKVTGAMQDAERVLRAANAAAPNDVEILNALAEIEEFLGRMDAAVEHLKQVETLDPRSQRTPGAIARVYDRSGRYEEAIRAREREIALTPADNAIVFLFHAWSYLLWRADTIAARRQVERGGPALWEDWLVRLPSGPASGEIWYHGVLPAASLRARDTLTLGGYRVGAGGLTPDLYYLMKVRHFSVTGRTDLARRYADTLIARLAPALRGRPDEALFWGLYSRRASLAEAYAVVGRAADGAREVDAYVGEARRAADAISLPQALVNAAYVDVRLERYDSAVRRLDEALQLHSGLSVSRALLRADPAWEPLRQSPTFERLMAEGDRGR